MLKLPLMLWNIVTQRHVILLLVLCVYGAASCSTTHFDPVYDTYSDCAVSCLACRDADYTTNFANDCDYASGVCCESSYHVTIERTWACVGDDCGSGVAQQAFNVFGQFCADAGKPLAKDDCPTGYQLNATGASADGSIAFRVVGAIAGIIGAYYTWRAIKRRRSSGGAGITDQSETGLQVVRWPQQRPWEMANFNLPPGHSVEYHTSHSNISFDGRTRYKETWQLRRDGAGVLTGGRVLGETDCICNRWRVVC
ncbi:hypothetical protein BJ170DRAFT_714680 [Xylariales sp. AK1849]|nr:hypothetical protein BJ170DRAFT_714680 [Xylariales sp. AK1849]